MAVLPEVLAHHAATQPDAVALDTPEGVLGYRQLWQQVSDLAGRLGTLGVARVGLAGDNTLGWVLADLACRLAGVVCVPIPPFFSPQQVNHLVNKAGLQVMLKPAVVDGVQDEFGWLNPWLVAMPLATGPGLTAMPEGTGKVTFTSGSTGTPKGVCLAHAQMDATVAALADRLVNLGIQRHLCLLPLATLLENIAGVYLPLTLGATVVLRPLAELGFNGASALDEAMLAAALRKTRPDSLILVPELAMALLAIVSRGEVSAAGFRFLAVGGARVSPVLLELAQAMGVPLYEGYGLSECGSVVALNSPGVACPGTVGQPLSHVRVTIAAGGEIEVWGSGFLGYLGETPRAPGSVRTGDLGVLQADGYLRVHGRAKNLIITSYGRNISPEWLESELLPVLRAQQVVVFGDGEPHPSALVYLGRDSDPGSIIQVVTMLNRRLPGYARLQRLCLLEHPLSRADGHLTANGRPRRQAINADLAQLLARAQCLSVAGEPSASRPEQPTTMNLI